MRHLMICVSGWAGTGKDECAGRLVKAHSAVHTGLADPGKRHMRDAYGFSDEQLWGPSGFRNAGDMRYPKPVAAAVGLQVWDGPLPEDVVDPKTGSPYSEELHGRFWYSDAPRSVVAGTPLEWKAYQPLRLGNARHFVRERDPDFWLSPREALQKYMELMNTLYADTWIRKGIEDHRRLATGENIYSRSGGVLLDREFQGPPELSVTCFSDFRHIHEHRLARESADRSLVPVLVRVKRPTVTRAPFDHRSETEQTRIRDAAYDFVIDNDRTLEDLYSVMDDIVRRCSDPAWTGKPWSPEYILESVQETYQP